MNCKKGVIVELPEDVKMVELWLFDFYGSIKLPEAPPRLLLTHRVSLDYEPLRRALLAVERLDYCFLSQEDLNFLYDLLNTQLQIDDEPPKAVQIFELSLGSNDGRKLVTLGKYPTVQHLTLEEISTTLHGENFTMLTSLLLRKGTFTLMGDFQSLRTLILHNATLVWDKDCTALTLQKVEFVGARDVDKFLISRKRFPALQQIILMHSFLDEEDVVVDESRFPILEADEKGDLAQLIVLRLDERVPKGVPHFASRVPTWVTLSTIPYHLDAIEHDSWTI